MIVTIKYYAFIRESIGKKEEKIEIPNRYSIKSLLYELANKYSDKLSKYILDKDGVIMNYIIYTINQTNIFSLQGYDTILEDGDVLMLLPPIGGG